MSDPIPLPDDVAALQALVLAQRALISERDLEIERLRVLIDKLNRMQYGRKSERIERQLAELETEFEDLTARRGIVDAQARRSGVPDAPSPREPLPPHLERELRVLEPEVACRDCGEPMRELGEDVSEQLARVAAAFKVIRTIRRKRVCPCCGHIEQPPMPGLPIERSIAHPSLLADILVSKYADHQPLYRQSSIAERDGVTLDTASMGRWVGQCQALCEPLTGALRRYTMAASKLHADDTPIPVLAPGNRKTKTGRLWVYVRDDHRSGSSEPAAVWFAYSPNRQGVHPQTHLADFRGILQADAYAGFNGLFTDGGIREAACWDHARRKLHDIHVRTPSETTTRALELIGELYAIEAGIRGQPPDERRRVRQEMTRPLLTTLETWLRERQAMLSAKSETSKAIQYALNNWAALVLYCDDGRVEISNILAENALRCVALGRKNFLFAGSDSGGERAAAMYSLIGSCKLNDIDPRAYLTYVLERIADHPVNRVDELLPWRVAHLLRPICAHTSAHN
jgi:transposase